MSFSAQAQGAPGGTPNRDRRRSSSVNHVKASHILKQLERDDTSAYLETGRQPHGFVGPGGDGPPSPPGGAASAPTQGGPRTLLQKITSQY